MILDTIGKGFHWLIAVNQYLAIPYQLRRDLGGLQARFTDHVIDEHEEHRMIRAEIVAISADAEEGRNRIYTKLDNLEPARRSELDSLRSELNSKLEGLHEEVALGFRDLSRQIMTVALAVRGGPPSTPIA